LKKPLLSTLIILLLSLACRLGGLARPEVTHYPQPDLAVELEPFRQAGCTADEYDRWTCPEASPLNALGCDALIKPNELLGGLDPAYPLALCRYMPIQHGESPRGSPTDEFIYNDGCLAASYVRYAIQKDGQFQLVKTQRDLKATYAPIESPDEALSYALASSSLEARYNLETPLGYRYQVNKLEDSHVVETGTGYEVLLYHYKVCGCGPHTTSAVLLQVTGEGDIQEIERTPAFEDPKEDGLCVD